MPTRRNLLKSAGGIGAATTLTGCQTLTGDQETTEQAADDSDDVAGDISQEPVNIAFIDFMSGPASPFGISATNMAKVLVEDINNNGGLVGQREINAQFIDENAGTDEMTSQLRTLATEEDTYAVIGVTSSANALALGPIANDLEQFLNIYMAGTHKVYDEFWVENDYKWVFRTGPMANIDGVSTALYAAKALEGKTIAGINQDYAWGHSTWDIFKTVFQKARPDAEIVAERFPPLFADDLTSHVTALSNEDPDIIFTSYWGADQRNFVQQGQAQGLFDQSEVILDLGDLILQEMGDQIPEGTIAGARGPFHFSYLYNERPERQQFVQKYIDEFDTTPKYPAFGMRQAILFLVNAIDRFVTLTGNFPTEEQLITAYEGTGIETSAAVASLPYHQAKFPAAVGRIVQTDEWDHPTISKDVQTFAANRLHPPEGMKTFDWLDRLELR